ncbi:MAG: hypothetical protein GEU73_08030 [Chloroflexi bacterium]|nr:hypothetical protein [Chloroflexota bacterium]
MDTSSLYSYTDYMTSYREAAVALWGEAGAFAHDAYGRWLALYPGLPEQLPIVIGITAYGKCWGLTRPTWEHDPRITLSSSIFAKGTRVVDDVMVHEMLHVWLAMTGQEIHHNSQAWYEAACRLSPAVLGHELSARRGADRRSVRVPNPRDGEPGQPPTIVRKVPVPDVVPHRAIATWPYSLRPPHAPPGDPIPCPTY